MLFPSPPLLSSPSLLSSSLPFLLPPSLFVAVQEVKLMSPDYQQMDPEQAVKDFETRIKNYELAYETLDHQRDKSVTSNSV